MNPSTSATPSPLPTDGSSTDPTTSFLINFGIGQGTFIVFLILYDILRYKFPGHCYYRSTAASNPANNNYDGTPLQSPDRPHPYPFAWVIPTLRYPMEKLVETHGLDAAMYLRFLQTQARIFLALSIYSLCVLIPTYVTTDQGKQSQTRGLEKATFGNIPDESRLLWVVLASEFVVLAIILMFLYLDIVKYTEYRLRYRADNKRNPANFAVLVMDVPPESRDQNYLFHVFNSIFPGQIVAVHPVRDAHHLLNLKMSYISTVNKRQRAQLSSTNTNSPKSNPPDPDIEAAAATSENGPLPLPKLPPSIGYEADEQPRLSSYINTPEVERSFPSERPLDPQHVDSQVNTDLANAVIISPTPQQLFPSEELSTSQVSGQPSSPKASNTVNFADKVTIAGDEGKQHSSQQFSLSSENPTGAQIPSGLEALTRPDSNDIVLYNRKVSKLRALIHDVEKDLDQYAPLSHAAFVVFRSKVAATCAVSTPIFPCAGKCKVLRAPDPRAINWNRINISRYTTRIREYVSFSVLTAMTLFWAVPSAFIHGLRNLSTLGADFKIGGIEEFVERYTQFARFLEGVLPAVLLFLVLLVIPQVFRFIISLERLPSRASAENKVRNFLFFFYVMSNFVYTVGYGTIIQVLKNIRDQAPQEILLFLQQEVPKQATFLMKYVLTNSFLGSVFGILNTGRLLFRPMVIARAKTDRDKIFADRMFADYPFAKMYALCMMISLISYVYTIIAPIINIVALLYFCLAYLCSKQLLLYSHRPMFEGGGFLFRDAWTGLLIGLYVHQLAMIAIFSLKKATLQVGFTTATLAFSVWFTVMCRNRFLSRIELGSLLNQSPVDEELGLDDEIPKKFINMYIHPGLKPVEVLENTEMDPATASIQRRESRRHSYHPTTELMLELQYIDAINV